MQTHLLQDLAIVMAVAGAMTLLCHRFRQPVVIGYILAGLLVGPYTPPFAFVRNLDSIHTMAELGLVFLMFSLGLEFNLPKIRRVGLSAILATLFEVTLMMGIGYLLGQAFGWKKVDSLFLGAILSISSTTIIIKVLMDFKLMHEKFAQVVSGILILEDIVAVAILSILSGLGTRGGPDTALILGSFMRISLFIILFLVLGLLLIPRFIHWVARFNVKEVLGIVTLGLCLGGSLLASSFQMSVALGAFLTGAVLAASKEITQIEDWIHPIRDMFSAIFFVSTGMLIQPQLIIQYKFPILIATVVTLIGKNLSGTVGSFIAGYDIKTSARVGMSIAQIGEFSFVIASLGLSLHVTSNFLYPLAIAVSSLTTLATPYMIRNSDHIVDAMLTILPPGIHATLNRYQSQLERVKNSQSQSHATAIFSKYLVRLGVYVAVLVALIMLARVLSVILLNKPLGIIWVWVGAALLALPLFMAISKYGNHVILLVVTSNKWILQKINVHIFYNTLYRSTMSALGLVFLISAAEFVGDWKFIAGIALGLLIVGTLLRRKISLIEEGLEKVLDHVIGLATSEPTRQAVLRSGERGLLLFDITDQITLPPDSLVQCQTIRALRIRELTRASVVAIYREGKHIANPSPDLELKPHDVLVLVGDEKSLMEARRLLLPE